MFALVAIADIKSCWPTLLEGWNDSKKQSEPAATPRFQPLEFLINRDKNNIDTCPANNSNNPHCSTNSWWYYAGPLFCILCIVEAVIRAKWARRQALDNAALDNFEKKLAQLYSATRCTVLRQQPGKVDYEDMDAALARNSLRTWTPVSSILFLWLVLLPWTSFFRLECGNDPAIATIWITQSMKHVYQVFTAVQSEFFSLLWKFLLPFNVLQPKRFYTRIRQLVRWIRHLRFAGPLFRMFLKLQDQLRVFLRTRSQAWQAQTEKAKRLAQRSMLFEDIRRIESLAKVQTALTSVPSQLLNKAQEQATEVGSILARKMEQGKRLKRRLENLKAQVRRSSSTHPSSDLYDKVVELTQELTTVSATMMNAHLVSPYTRFSVVWRIIVTIALLSELSRLFYSYQLSGTFEVSTTDMFASLLAECDRKMSKQFRFLTSRGRKIRALVGKILRFPNSELAECLPSRASSKLILLIAGIWESVIDAVCFIDIFVWFFTGEIDIDGVVVPKPFFPRCILPGTLVQVLDHPTLPDKLPQLILYSMGAMSAAGYSRIFRWALALCPAMDMLLVDPVKSYLFRPMDDDEWLRYTESFAVIPVLSGANIRSVLSGASIRGAGMPSFSNASLLRRTDNSANFLRRMDSSANLTTLTSSPSYAFLSTSKRRFSENMDDSYSFSYNLHY